MPCPVLLGQRSHHGREEDDVKNTPEFRTTTSDLLFSLSPSPLHLPVKVLQYSTSTDHSSLVICLSVQSSVCLSGHMSVCRVISLFTSLSATSLVTCLSGHLSVCATTLAPASSTLTVTNYGPAVCSFPASIPFIRSTKPSVVCPDPFNSKPIISCTVCLSEACALQVDSMSA